MYFNPRFSTLLLPLVLLLSCQDKIVTDLPRNPIQQTAAPAPETLDRDHYFTSSTYLTRQQGPNTIVRNILQDKQDIIWLATWDGIVSYDGTEFTNHTNKEKLRRYRVFTIIEDRNGILWFGTVGAGLYRYDGKKFENLTTKDGLVHDKIGCFYEDREGNLWIGTQAGLSIYDGKTFKNYTTEDGLPNSDLNSIIQDSKGTFWIGARGVACTFDGEKFSIVKTEQGQQFTNVRSLLYDKNQNIWIGGNDGLWFYDGNSFKNFSKDFTGYIYEDQKGNVWTNSAVTGNTNYSKLSKYDPLQLPVIAPTSTVIHEKENMFFGILEDRAGGIWLGTLYGPRKYNGKEFDYFK